MSEPVDPALLPNAGKVPSFDDLQNDLYWAAVGIRDAMAKAVKLWDYVGPVGEAGLQGPPWNMTPELAASFYLAANHEFALTQLYNGSIAQPEPFDYDDSLAPVRGGQ